MNKDVRPLTHEEAVRIVNEKFARICKVCYHVDTGHAALHEVDRFEYARGGCSFCWTCTQYIPLSPMDICELVESLKVQSNKTLYDRVHKVFSRNKP